MRISSATHTQLPERSCLLRTRAEGVFGTAGAQLAPLTRPLFRLPSHSDPSI